MEAKQLFSTILKAASAAITQKPVLLPRWMQDIPPEKRPSPPTSPMTEIRVEGDARPGWN